jgi:ABC-type molybdate transport system ATPase subunit
VFGAPASEPVARFVRVENLLPGRVVTVTEGIAEVDVGAARLTVAAAAHPGERVLIGCRPEDLTLAPASAGGLSSAQNRLAGRIVTLAPLGPLWRGGVDCGVPLTALVTRAAVEALGLTPGVPISVLVKATALHLVRRGPRDLS